MISLEPYSQQFLRGLVDLDRPGAQAVVEAALAAGADPARVLLEVVAPAMDEVGRQQANRDITLSQVYVIAKIVEAAVSRLSALVPAGHPSGRPLVLGTAEGDYHGLGRKIVATFLRAAGFDVRDLGMSVSAEGFVDAAVAAGARVICVSALLLHTAENIKQVRALLRARGLEGQIKLVVGGAAFSLDPELYREVEADAMGHNALDAVAIARQWLGDGAAPSGPMDRAG